MGIPIGKILKIVGAIVAGVNIGNPTDKTRLEGEIRENQLLAQLLKQQQLTNTILLRIMAEAMDEDEFAEFVKDLG